MQICTNVPPPPIPIFNGNGSVRNVSCNGNVVSQFPPTFVNNPPYFPHCNTNFTNVPPPSFNGMICTGNIRPPMAIADSNRLCPPPNCFSNNNPFNNSQNFPPFPQNYSHPPGTYNPIFQNNSGMFPNYSIFPPPNYQFSRPPPPINSPQLGNSSSNLDTRQNSFNSRQFNQNHRKMKQEQVNI